MLQIEMHFKQMAIYLYSKASIYMPKCVSNKKNIIMVANMIMKFYNCIVVIYIWII